MGYNTQDKTGKQYVSLSPAFITTGATGTFKLSDVALDGGDVTSDTLQVLESTKASVGATYVYLSAAQAAAWDIAGSEGWYDASMENSMNDVSFPIGTAFLGNFTTKTVSSTYSGQVVDGTVEMDCTGKQYVMFGNPLPRVIKLGEIVLDGGDVTSDTVQILEPTKASVGTTYVYLSAAQAAAWDIAGSEGWYDAAMENSMNDVDINIGDAFLGNFTTKSVSITFPTAL